MKLVNRFLARGIWGALSTFFPLLALGLTFTAHGQQCSGAAPPQWRKVGGQAYISLSDGGGGCYDIAASCKVETFQPVTSVEFRSADLTISSANRSIFQRVPILEDGKTLQCTPIDVFLGSGQSHSDHSLQCLDDRTAVLELPGYTAAEANEQIQRAYQNSVKSMLPAEERDNPFGNFLFSLMSGVGGFQAIQMDAQATHITDVLATDSMSIRLYLQNGKQPVLNIPLEQSFKGYLRDCAPATLKGVPSASGNSVTATALSPEAQFENYMTGARGNASNGNYAAAINDYNQALRLQPRNQDAQNGLADAQAAQQQQAEKERQRQIAQLMTTAQGNCSQGNFAAAIDSYNRVIGMDQGNQAARNGLAVAQAAQTGQAEWIAQQAAAGQWPDLQTHLMWTIKDNGDDVTWKKANEYCQTLRAGGNADWQLATIDQLQGLYDQRFSQNTVPLAHTRTILYLTRNNEVEYKGSSWTYHIKGGITLTGPGVWSGSSREGFNEDRWWLFFAKGTRDWSETGEKMEMRALCVRPYVPPTDTACNSESAQTSQVTQQTEQVAVNQAMAVSSAATNPSVADRYFIEAQAALGEATMDTKTGKMVLPPECAAGLRKYLELAPNGPHAKEAKQILDMAGLSAKPN